MAIECSPEKFTEGQFENQPLVQSPEPYEKLGGSLALDGLINPEGVEAAQKPIRFASYLHNAFRSNDYVVLGKAAPCRGHSAKPGGALTTELVENEIESAMAWLQSNRQDGRRLAAVLKSPCPTSATARLQTILNVSTNAYLGQLRLYYLTFNSN